MLISFDARLREESPLAARNVLRDALELRGAGPEEEEALPRGDVQLPDEVADRGGCSRQDVRVQETTPFVDEVVEVFPRSIPRGCVVNPIAPVPISARTLVFLAWF